MKKGRPRKEELEYIVKFKIDDKDNTNITNLSNMLKKTKSDVMREILPVISSKEFENMIPSIALEQLQYYSEQCWKTLHFPGCIFETKEINKNMPAFVTTFAPYKVYVKYPTYKVQIINKRNETENTVSVTIQEIDNLLKNIKNISSAYASPTNYIVGQYNSKNISFITEVTCLSANLEDNIEAKNEIVKKLYENEYSYSVFPYYCIRSDDIVFISDNEDEKKYFKINSSTKTIDMGV